MDYLQGNNVYSRNDDYSRNLPEVSAFVKGSFSSSLLHPALRVECHERTFVVTWGQKVKTGVSCSPSALQVIEDCIVLCRCREKQQVDTSTRTATRCCIDKQKIKGSV